MLILLVLLAYQSVILNTPGDILYWRLGERTGTHIQDISGRNNHGIYKNNPVLGVKGAITNDSNTAVKFTNYEHGYLVSSNNLNLSNTNKVSIEFWFDTSNTVWYGGSHFLTHGNFWEDSWIELSTQDNHFDVTVKPGDVFKAVPPSNPGWHHFVVTINRNRTDANRVRIYIDGEDRTIPRSVGTVSNNFTSGMLSVGAFGLFGVPSNGTAAGTFDELVIYNRILSRNTARAHYQCQRPRTCR